MISATAAAATLYIYSQLKNDKNSYLGSAEELDTQAHQQDQVHHHTHNHPHGNGNASAAPEEPSFLTKKWNSLKESFDDFIFTIQNLNLVAGGYLLIPEKRVDRLTVVVDLADLIYLEPQRDVTKRARKRPGADDFINNLAEWYEVILWSSNPNVMADVEHAQKLDPRRVVAHTFYYPQLILDRGLYIKDLGRLNRDLSRVVMVTSNEKSFYPIHRDNVVLIPKWEGERTDTALLDTMQFLKVLNLSLFPEKRSIPEIIKQEGSARIVQKYSPK